MDALRNSEQPVDFDESFLLKTRPPLGAAEDFDLSAKEVIKIFGINESSFSPIPSRLVVPVLEGDRSPNGLYHTTGWLYIVEPQEWYPVVRHGDTVTASKFQSPNSLNCNGISEANFNRNCKASIEFQHGGSYYGSSIGVTQSNDIAFKYSSTSLTEDALRKKGMASDALVEEFLLYPILRCKAIRKQRIDYTVNEKTEDLEWGKKSSNPEYREDMRVRSSRLGRISQMQFHPVPVDEGESEDEARVLPAPRIKPNGDLEVVTLLSRADWMDWYIYEAEFQDCSETIDLAAPRNNVAFHPTSCWTTLLEDIQPPPSQGIINSAQGGRSGSRADKKSDEGGGLVIECALEPLIERKID